VSGGVGIDNEQGFALYVMDNEDVVTVLNTGCAVLWRQPTPTNNCSST